MKRVAGDLAAMRRHLAAVLGWPDNLGIQMLDLQIGAARGLLLWVDGLAAEEAVASAILAPLSGYQGPPKLGAVAGALQIPHRWEESDMAAILASVLAGEAALLLEGAERALLLDTQSFQFRVSDQIVGGSTREAFGRRLRLNMAMVRRRIQDVRMRAVRLRLPNRQRGEVAMLYLEGKAWPPLVRRVRQWSRNHLGEEAGARGLPSRAPAVLGALPRFGNTRSPDEAAVLLDAGCVLLLTDRLSTALVAPVTAPAWVMAPSDFGERYPVKRLLTLWRLGLYAFVLLLPAVLIGLLNYHVDMVPTSFLAAMASVRENAPFGTFFEVLIVEVLTEVVREVVFHAPAAVSPGGGLLAEFIFLLLAVQSGFIGPLPALVGAAGALASLALPTQSGAYLLRVWRFYLMGAAGTFGFFGMATVVVVLLSYLCRAQSWGVPFLGPPGLKFTSPEGSATRPPGAKGGGAGASSQTRVR
jgi:hypothetical protein